MISSAMPKYLFQTGIGLLFCPAGKTNPPKKQLFLRGNLFASTPRPLTKPHVQLRQRLGTAREFEIVDIGTYFVLNTAGGKRYKAISHNLERGIFNVHLPHVWIHIFVPDCTDKNTGSRGRIEDDKSLGGC